MKVIFSADENSIVVGDKTGDVYLLNLDSNESEFKLIMGHLSMLTDLVKTLKPFFFNFYSILTRFFFF